jgi:hypothetical protein
LVFRIILEPSPQHADAPQLVALLCPRRNWPYRSAAEARNKFVPSHRQSSSFKIGAVTIINKSLSTPSPFLL